MSNGSGSPQGPGWWLASDGRWYPPATEAPTQTPHYQTPQYQTPQYQTPQYQTPSTQNQQYQTPQPQPGAFPTTPAKSSGCLKAFLVIAGILAVLFVLLVVALGIFANKAGHILEKSTRQMKQNEVPVVPGTCGVNSTSNGEATGTITNKTDEEQGFEVRVRMIRDGVDVDQASTVLQRVPPGATAQYQVTGTAAIEGPITCVATVYATFMDTIFGVPLDSLATTPTT